MNIEIADLAHEIEAALSINDQLADRAIAAIQTLHIGRDLKRGDIDSPDRMLEIVYEGWPGWDVSTRGKARLPNGHWRCTLRRSSTRDDDEFIGVGRGPTLAHAILAAALHLIAVRD